MWGFMTKTRNRITKAGYICEFETGRAIRSNGGTIIFINGRLVDLPNALDKGLINSNLMKKIVGKIADSVTYGQVANYLSNGGAKPKIPQGVVDKIKQLPITFTHSDPTNDDIDNDGLTDAQEKALGTNPRMYDTDKDGIWDGDDVYPLKKNSNAKSLLPWNTPEDKGHWYNFFSTNNLMSLERYTKNLTFEITGFIFGQRSSKVKDMGYGCNEELNTLLDKLKINIPYISSKVADNGCELVAIYNALLLHKKHENLSNIIYEFELNPETAIAYSAFTALGITVPDYMPNPIKDVFNSFFANNNWDAWRTMDGVFGTDPFSLGRYFNNHNHIYEFTDDLATFESWAKKDRVFIISKWNRTKNGKHDFFGGLHTFAIQYVGDGKYNTWNRFSNDESNFERRVCTINDMIGNGQFICGYYLPIVR
jgi:hypothetical protein